jgi:hypothetical protein
MGWIVRVPVQHNGETFYRHYLVPGSSYRARLNAIKGICRENNVAAVKAVAQVSYDA